MMRQARGIFCIVTAIVAGYWGSRAMFTLLPDTSLFWLPMLGFGTAVLLLVGGLFTLFPKVRKMWLLVLTAGILATFWAVFVREFSASYCILTAISMLVTWVTLTWASASERPAIVAFIASVSLTLLWLPASLSVLHSTALVASLVANGPIVALWILIIAASVLSGLALFRPQRAW